MPDMKKGDSERGPHDLLNESLEAVRRDDAETEIPPHLEGLVMRAWDAGAGLSVNGRSGGPSYTFWFAAVAATVMLAVAVRLQRGDGAGNPDETRAGSALEESFAGFAEYPLESLAAVDMILDEDPAFLQCVQMSVEPSVLTAFGFPVPDPADDQPVEVEVLVGLDGVPRAIRHSNFVQE